jgi:hypothetical protein
VLCLGRWAGIRVTALPEYDNQSRHYSEIHITARSNVGGPYGPLTHNWELVLNSPDLNMDITESEFLTRQLGS